MFVIAAVLQIGAWILFGRKLDRIEAFNSANAAHLQNLESGIRHTNQTLDAIYSLCGQALGAAEEG